MSSLFNIGVSGLKAQQAALNVVGQNITNASTPGYSRQRADIVAQTGALVAGLSQAAGARVDNIQRIADGFIDEQIRSDMTLFSELDSYKQFVGQLEGALFDSDHGIDVAMQDFFDAMQNAANEPSDLAMRQFVISNGNALADRFSAVTQRSWLQARDVGGSLEAITSQVNELAGTIAQLNDRIAGFSLERTSGGLNTLIDQREVALKELSSLVSVTVSEQEAGELNVFVGKGQPLVLGVTAASMEVSGAGDVVIRPVGAQQPQVITSAVSGGQLGGVLKYREEVLWPAQNELGRLAAAMVSAINDQHRAGVDLEGEFGANFFGDINAPELIGERTTYLGNDGPIGSNGNIGQVNVYIDDPFNGEASDYEVRFSESDAGAYTVTRRSDGEIVYSGSSIVPPQTLEFDGIRVEFASGEFAPGDSLLVRPYADFGTQMRVALENPTELALAMPVRVVPDATNGSSAQVDMVGVTDPAHPLFNHPDALTPPMLIRFVSPTQYQILDNSNPGDPQPLQPDLGLLTYVAGGQNSLLPELGSSLVTTSGPDVTGFPAVAGVVANLDAGTNGYAGGLFQIQRSDADGGALSSVVFNPNASAREMATRLNAEIGVDASARTEIELSNLVDYNSGTPVELAINGQLFSGFTGLGDLADQISADETLAAAGLVARSDGTTLRLESLVGDDISLHFSGDPNESVDVHNPRGDTMTLVGNGAGTYQTITVGGEVSAILDPEYSVTTEFDGVFAAVPEHVRADLGFALHMTGNVEAGDEFLIDFNSGGIADNRNALALSALSDRGFEGFSGRNFAGLFAGVVQEVGMRSSQAEINRSAAESLLQQSEAFRESVSGVNLDEEAADLIRFEQAYNASAQVISVARDIFSALLQAVA